MRKSSTMRTAKDTKQRTMTRLWMKKMMKGFLPIKILIIMIDNRSQWKSTIGHRRRIITIRNMEDTAHKIGILKSSTITMRVDIARQLQVLK